MYLQLQSAKVIFGFLSIYYNSKISIITISNIIIFLLQQLEYCTSPVLYMMDQS